MKRQHIRQLTVHTPSPPRRRGVSSVLAMMFLVIFSSLAAAMAVVAQGNLRTADSYLKVSRAMSAAETGLVFATRRLERESRRFVVDKGVIDTDFGHALWMGQINPTSHGDVEVLPPEGYDENTLPDGLMYAVRNAHMADGHNITVEPGDGSLPSVNEETGTVIAPPAALLDDDNTPYFRLKYQLLADEPVIRVTSRGFDGSVSRTLQLDFRINKHIEYAIVSPNRIMIGKNVRIEGPLGSRYGVDEDGDPNLSELSAMHGHPLVMRSDFYYLDDDLDSKLDVFHQAVAEYDVDGDGRLRPNHPIESQGLQADPNLLDDYTGDGYVTDFDLFLAHYDSDDDGRVVYDTTLAGEAGYSGLPLEFDDDDQLARLIDMAFPDRDDDGERGTDYDIALGYSDGILDAKDMYAKIHGRVALAVARDDWENAQNINYQEEVMGPIRPENDVPPMTFEADTDLLREITTDMFNNSMHAFVDMAVSSLQAQVEGQGGTYPSDVTVWEEVAYESEGAYDHFKRPVYEGMTFENVRIEPGTNALFKNCTFIGVTYIETETENQDVNWNYVGAVEKVEHPPGSGDYIYPPKFAGMTADLPNGTAVSDTKPYSNNIRFHDCTFIGSISADKPEQYTHWRNKIQHTGDTRFYIDPEDPGLEDDPDGENIIDTIEAMDDDDLDELRKSSILLPGWSINVGSFTNNVASDPQDTPRVNLKGTIVAGIFDVRGTVDVHGTLLMTYRPKAGEGPLFHGGQPPAFNTTIGYFGPSDGDYEGVDPDEADFDGFGEISLRYDPEALLPDGIPWPISVRPIEHSYSEGGAM